jgi:hypothetical protein
MLRPLCVTTLALGLLATAAFAANPCEGPGPAHRVAIKKAGWTNVVPANAAGRIFTATRDHIAGVEVDVVTGNPRKDESDTLTLTLSNLKGDVLTKADQTVTSGKDGWLCFALPEGGIDVNPGDTLLLTLEDTGKVLFGWRYSNDNPTFDPAKGEFDFGFRVHDGSGVGDS